MKARIKKTGEIVEIISYSCFVDRNKLVDNVSYIDSNGVEHDKEPLNYYWDFEPIEDKNIDEAHWRDVRERAAIAAMQGSISILGSNDRSAFREIVVEGFSGDKKTYPNEIAEFAVACADALVKLLNKQNNETN